MLDLLGLLSKSAPNVHAFTSLDQNPLVYKVKLWHTEALKTADFLKIRIAVRTPLLFDIKRSTSKRQTESVVCLDRPRGKCVLNLL